MKTVATSALSCPELRIPGRLVLQTQVDLMTASTHWTGGGWASELLWAQRLEEKLFSSAGNQTPIVQSVVRHYSDE
jgi:hypothetical protein